jgi:hypothetical protein
LEKTPLFAQAHVDAAVLGQTPVPDDINSTLHFIVFVKAPSPKEKGTERIVELDGRRPVPVDQGECKDFLQDVANIVKKKYISESTSKSIERSLRGEANLLRLNVKRSIVWNDVSWSEVRVNKSPGLSSFHILLYLCKVPCCRFQEINDAK